MGTGVCDCASTAARRDSDCAREVCEVPGCSAPSGFVDPGRRTLSRLLWATPSGACAQLVNRGALLPAAALPAACAVDSMVGSSQTKQPMSGVMIPWRDPSKIFYFRKKKSICFDGHAYPLLFLVIDVSVLSM